jgi:serine/threonine protein kinase
LNFLKLKFASGLAVGLAHVHGVDDRPSMVHYDLHRGNIAVVAGTPKLNDFNLAEFLRYNPKTNQTCGFRSREPAPWLPAPEEVTIGNGNVLNEKVDIYSLGILIFHVLTTRWPRGGRFPTIRPQLDDDVAERTDPALVVLKEVMDMCYEPDPTRRPSSRHVASLLMRSLAALQKNYSNVTLERLELPL